MRRHSPGYRSPPRRGYGARGRSPPRRGYGGHKEPNNGSLLVRNIPLNSRCEDLRIPFERFGPVRDVYIPKDYYSGEPRGFAFVQFVDPYDASEAQYHMNRQIFGGREITVVVASETRKRPDEMRKRGRVRGSTDYDGGRRSYYGGSRSRSISRSRSPRRPSNSRMRHQSRSYSPAPRHRDEYSASPRKQPPHRDDYSASPRKQPSHSRSPRGNPQGNAEKQNHRSYSPKHGDGNRKQVDRVEDPRRRSYTPTGVNPGRNGSAYDYKEKQARRPSHSPSGSRSRSADSSRGRNR